MAEPVNENLCAERMKVQDERFARDMERIKALEDTCEELRELSIQMGELLKKYDEELRDHRQQLKEQGDRVTSIEQRPAKWWEKLTGAIITALGSALGGCLLTLLVQNMIQK